MGQSQFILPTEKKKAPSIFMPHHKLPNSSPLLVGRIRLTEAHTYSLTCYGTI